MCLYSETKQPKVAEKEITVYKFLYENEKGVLCTPFYTTPIPQIPYRLVAEGEREIEFGRGRLIFKPVHINPEVEDIDDSGYYVGRGFIHSYSEQTVAEKAVDDSIYEAFVVSNCIGYKFKIVKCHIPIGVEYFVGEDGDLCSTELVLDEIVSTIEYFKSIFGGYVQQIDGDTFSTLLHHLNNEEDALCVDFSIKTNVAKEDIPLVSEGACVLYSVGGVQKGDQKENFSTLSFIKDAGVTYKEREAVAAKVKGWLDNIKWK